MLSVILIWLYIGITTYTLGYGALKLLTSISFMCDYKGSKPTPYKIRYQENYIVAGLIITTVYAQVFSLFSGVGLIANVILVLICLSVIFVFREELFLRIRSLFRVLNSTHSMYLYVLVFLLMAFGTSEGLMHYDTGLYHAQAIHWIEDYGVVKGLGNLHVRLAYNSSAFPLTALYSFSFLGQSFHVTAGFFALLLAWQCIDLKDIARRKHPVVPDFARLLAIYYLFNIFDEMVSPASDYYVTCLIFYIIIHWLDLNVSKEESFVPYAFLSMAIVYAITLKLSAVPFIIMMIKPISMLRVRDKSIIKKMEKKERQKNAAGKNRFQKTEKFTLPKKRSLKAFFLCFIICIMIAVPFVIRNAIISGWLIYPFTGLDLLNVSWKIPKGVAEYDAREIAVYGRGYTDVTQYDIPISQWLPGWISGLGLFNKVMLIGDIISFVIFVIWGTTLAILNKISSGKKDKSKLMVQNNIFKLSRTRRLGMVDFMLVEFTCFA
ncbi:MAG: hypothetical protein K6B41_00570, partial [Butyrivibrio sp.]|nr:hypothetical protein [Butyrivibrio sp.]